MIKGSIRNTLNMLVLLAVVASAAGVFLAWTPAMKGAVIPVRVGQQPAAAIEWTEAGKYIAIPSDLVIAEHAAKHFDQHLDAWRIYAMLLEGQCVATAVFCGGSEVDRLYLCQDPSGRIGGLIVLADEILTGYEGKLRYWENVVERDRWEVCQ